MDSLLIVVKQEVRVVREQLAAALQNNIANESQVKIAFKRKSKLTLPVIKFKQREIEYKDQIDRLRKEKRDLEARLGGVDLSQMQKDSAVILEMESKVKRGLFVCLTCY